MIRGCNFFVLAQYSFNKVNDQLLTSIWCWCTLKWASEWCCAFMGHYFQDWLTQAFCRFLRTRIQLSLCSWTKTDPLRVILWRLICTLEFGTLYREALQCHTQLIGLQILFLIVKSVCHLPHLPQIFGLSNFLPTQSFNGCCLMLSSKHFSFCLYHTLHW